MNIQGILTYCNRCGFKIFRRAEKKVLYQENGYFEIWREIDNIPDDWIVYNDEHLCPKCAQDWKKVIMPIDGGKNA